MSSPSTCGVNFTPSSTALGSLTDGFTGVPFGGSRVATVAYASVVNDHEYAEVIALPALSVADTVAVYPVLVARLADGVKVAVFEALSYVVEPATLAEPSERVNEIVAGLTALEKVAVGCTPTAAYWPPETGEVDRTVGGAMSLSVKTGST